MNEKLDKLQLEISELQNKIHITDEIEQLTQQLEAKQIELNHLIKIKTQGAIIRSRLRPGRREKLSLLL